MPEEESIDNIEYCISPEEARQIVPMLKALGHPLRLRIVAYLTKQGCNVKRMTECLGVAQATVSQQLAVLRASGLVLCERKGNRVCYELARPRLSQLVRLLAQIAEEEKNV